MKCTLPDDKYGFTINSVEIVSEKGDRYYACADDMLVSMTVNGLQVTALIDSGSAISCLSDEFLTRLRPKINPRDYQRNFVIHTRAANKGPIQCLGLVKNLEIKVEDFQIKVDLPVLKVGHDLVIGRDLGRVYGIQLDMKSDTVSFGNKKMIVVNAIDVEPKSSYKPLSEEQTETFLRHVTNNNLSKVKDFITKYPGAPNCQKNGMTPLLVAVDKGHANLVLHLAREGARLIAKDNRGCNA